MIDTSCTMISKRVALQKVLQTIIIIVIPFITGALRATANISVTVSCIYESMLCIYKNYSVINKIRGYIIIFY